MECHMANPGGCNDAIQIGDDGKLYWDGKPVAIGSPVVLTDFQTIIAVIGAIAALRAAVAAGFQPTLIGKPTRRPRCKSRRQERSTCP